MRITQSSTIIYAPQHSRTRFLANLRAEVENFSHSDAPTGFRRLVLESRAINLHFWLLEKKEKKFFFVFCRVRETEKIKNHSSAAWWSFAVVLTLASSSRRIFDHYEMRIVIKPNKVNVMGTRLPPASRFDYSSPLQSQLLRLAAVINRKQSDAVKNGQTQMVNCCITGCWLKSAVLLVMNPR